MSSRMRHTLGPLIGYHGCDRSVGEAVLAGKIELQPSINEYDWLGPGILRRTLDCAVINTVHRLREDRKIAPYDTVYGFFEEGPRLYPTSGFRAKTHVQIAVRNTQCIVGYFRVKGI